ncbi:hypothetical protein [Synechococcus sp. MIT S1220]|uniref:hypothetical protein n=1 Tax=Synechococcus sp. MIT S1220 TaxID=3082549 RepID=UPI0039B0BEA0
MSKNSFQSSDKKTSPAKEESSESNFWAPTGWGALNGTGASIATEILDDALVAMKRTKYGKYYEGTKLAIESVAGLVLNEGLEVSKDKEKGFWGDGYLDFAEDVALTVGGNYLGGLAAAALLGSSAPVLATAAIGIATASVIGGSWSWGKSLIADYFSEDTTIEASAELGAGIVTSQNPGSNNQANQSSQYTYYLEVTGNSGTGNSGSFDDSLNFDVPSNNEQQDGEDEELSDEEKAQRIADYLTKMREEEDAMDEEIFGDDYEVEDEPNQAEGEADNNNNQNTNQDGESSLWDDFVNWLFGDDESESDASDDPLTIRAKVMDNPMNDNGDTSDYDGRHDGLRGFRGDIDYGPDGKKGQGYNGEHDELIGFNPRIDYGPDGKKGQGYNGEHNGLKGFNPRIDWDQDHVDTDEFTGNALTDRLGKINPRAIQEVLGSMSIAENGRQAKKMGRTDSEFIFNSQAGVLYHNASGAKKGFGSGGAIAEIEIDQDLSLISVDFF